MATVRRVVSERATVADLKHLATAQAAKAYRKRFWGAAKGDDLPDCIRATTNGCCSRA